MLKRVHQHAAALRQLLSARPRLDDDDRHVLGEIEGFRRQLRYLRT